MTTPKASIVRIHQGGATSNVPAHYFAPERERAPVTLAQWQASKRPPAGFFASVWGLVRGEGS